MPCARPVALAVLLLALPLALALAGGAGCRSDAAPEGAPAPLAPAAVSLTGYRALRVPPGAGIGAAVPVVSPDAEIVVRVALPSPPAAQAAAADDARWVAVVADGPAGPVALGVAPAAPGAAAALVRARLSDHAIAVHALGPGGPGHLVALAGRGAPPFPEAAARWVSTIPAPSDVGRAELAWEISAPPDPAALAAAEAALRTPAPCALDGAAWDAALAALPPEGRVLAWERLGKAWWTCRDLGAMRDAFERGAAIAHEAGLPSLAAQLLRVRASREHLAGRLDLATEVLERARRAAPPADVVGQVRWLNTRAWVDGLLGETERAFGRLGEGLALALDHGLDYEAAFFRMSQATLLTDLGQHGRARRLLDAARRWFAAEWERTPDPRSLVGRGYGLLLTNSAWTALSAPAPARRPGDLAAAEWDLVRALGIARALGEAVDEANIQANRAWAAFLEGDLARADALLDAAESAAGGLPGVHHTFVVDLRGRVALAAGRPADALAAFDRLATLDGGHQPAEVAWRAAHGRGLALAALDRPHEALAALTDAVTAVDALSRQAPLFQGRAEFLGAREDPASDAIALLLDHGDPEAAVVLAERERARVLRALEARLQPERLPPADRALWRARVAAVHDARTACD